MLHLAAAGGDHDRESITGHKVGGAVSDGEGELGGEGRGHSRNPDDDAIRIFDLEFAEVRARLDAGQHVGANLGSSTNGGGGRDGTVAGIAGDSRASGRALGNLAENHAGGKRPGGAASGQNGHVLTAVFALRLVFDEVAEVVRFSKSHLAGSFRLRCGRATLGIGEQRVLLGIIEVDRRRIGTD